ncbi:MAG TPA: hypothetical protein DCZ04_08520, partial [Syntrophorhabdus aromaticivorans]|nr:hypothetical protein [Syntrophorhabdus aromaticivorans]
MHFPDIHSVRRTSENFENFYENHKNLAIFLSWSSLYNIGYLKFRVNKEKYRIANYFIRSFFEAGDQGKECIRPSSVRDGRDGRDER